MKVTNNKILQNWILILLIMVLGFSLVGIYILFSGNAFTKEATESFYNYNLKEKKEQSRLEVSNRLDEIIYEQNKILDSEKIVLLDKIEHIKLHLLLSLKNQNLNEDDMKLWAVNEYEHEISSDKDYLYFILSPDGYLIRSGTDNNIVGVSLINNIDTEGNYFVQEMIKAKDNPKGIYVNYYWPKVKGGQPKKKTSYCLYIPEFDFIIGTGVYYEDFQEQLKEKIYERLQTYYENKQNYVFVTDFDSTARVAANPDLLNTKMDSIKSFDGKSIHEEFLNVLKNSDGGFSSYQYYKKNEDQLTEKIAYVHKLEEWGSYIGYGFYLDDLKVEVQNYTSIFKKHYYNQTLYIVLGLLLLSLIVYAIFQRGAYMQKIMLKKGDHIYEKLFELSNDAIVVVSDKANYVLYQNDIATKLFGENTNTQITSQLRNFVAVDDLTFLYLSTNQRKHYLHIRKEHASYSSKESTIFFIDDVTKQYLESNELEKMAYIDELTGLRNRRSLKDTYEDLSDEIDDNNNYIFGMLDIDKFKVVNDTHGHPVGDIVLKILSDTFNSRLRDKDYFFRFGGEEFIIILNNISIIQAKKLLERINLNFSELVQNELGFSCTFSCGLITLNKVNKDHDLDSQVLLADELLYKAKDNGRNRIET